MVRPLSLIINKLLPFLLLVVHTTAHAEDGSRLWLRYAPMNKALVSGVEGKAAQVLRQYYSGSKVTLLLDPQQKDQEGFRITISEESTTVSAGTEHGLLYGAFALLRGETGYQAPFFKYRILNHWDNLDGSIERGYAGESIFWNDDLTFDPRRLEYYAMANAAIGINGVVLNNVNASPKMLSRTYLQKVKEIADIMRPWGIRVYLSVNFASPMALGKLKTADPLDEKVRNWWKEKTKEVYQLVPDFGGFLVKANSEGQPGPFDYGRSHAEGANMLAEALAPHQGIVMWRSFVYGAKHKGEDRVKQAVSEFAELDGAFLPNVILQSKNGPLDFQPREPYAPIFDQMHKTPQMAELQITQEYLGQSKHLVYLAPMWREFFGFVNPSRLVGIAGVANIGDDTNWCGHHFSQANWYAFGRLAWDPTLSSEQIAWEWLSQTFDASVSNQQQWTQEKGRLLDMMLRSREACVDYMMPLGLHHIFKFDHHMGPEPDGFKAEYPIEWCPVYYHKADSIGVGFNRSSSGTNATAQYREPYHTLYNNIATCPEMYLLWFHHVPWDYRMKSGRTLWEEIQCHYQHGVEETNDFLRIWEGVRPCIDPQRWQEVNDLLLFQQQDAREWQRVCIEYFKTFQH
ncbi:MAG: alpha-glucuronidase [Prevotella sp.]|nr:alpha-glucuronidase [Prevotella sp.]